MSFDLKRTRTSFEEEDVKTNFYLKRTGTSFEEEEKKKKKNLGLEIGILKRRDEMFSVSNLRREEECYTDLALVLIHMILYRLNARVHNTNLVVDKDLVPWATPFLADYKIANYVGRVGFGIIICNHLGGVVASSSQFVMAPQIAETVAIFRGLVFARDAGLLPCSVETDAQVIVNLIMLRHCSSFRNWDCYY
ncbi:hypothetical protein Q3G72_005776 [Acer saccharum]|nr:hypothetical protein Q3G72_005776 [Acer saccharum]